MKLSTLKNMLKELNETEEMKGTYRDIRFFEKHFNQRKVDFAITNLTTTSKTIKIFL